MKSAAEPTASSTCSGLEAKRTSLPTPLRKRSFEFCLFSEKASAGSLDACQKTTPPIALFPLCGYAILFHVQR
jgi:hypothetical protein